MRHKFTQNEEEEEEKEEEINVSDATMWSRKIIAFIEIRRILYYYL